MMAPCMWTEARCCRRAQIRQRECSRPVEEPTFKREQQGLENDQW